MRDNREQFGLLKSIKNCYSKNSIYLFKAVTKFEEKLSVSANRYV